MLLIQGRSVSIMIVYAIIIHYTWAIGVVLDPTALNVTAVHGLHKIFSSAGLLSLVLIVAATLALITLFYRSAHSSAVLFVTMLLPQQFLLMVSATGAIEAIWTGQFADGVQRTAWFLFSDQCYSIYAVLGHTAAIVGHAMRSIYSGR